MVYNMIAVCVYMNGVNSMLIICELYEIVCLVNSIGEIVEH